MWRDAHQTAPSYGRPPEIIAGSSTRASQAPNGRERLLQVRPDVLDILQATAEANEVVLDAILRALLWPLQSPHNVPLRAVASCPKPWRAGTTRCLWQRHVHAGSHAVILPDKAGAAAHVRRLCGHALLLLPCMGGNPTRTAAKTRLVPVGDDGGLFDEGLDAAQGGRNVGQPHAVHKLGRAPQVRSHLRMQGSPLSSCTAARLPQQYQPNHYSAGARSEYQQVCAACTKWHGMMAKLIMGEIYNGQVGCQHVYRCRSVRCAITHGVRGHPPRS